jgi:hypothetical protein
MGNFNLSEAAKAILAEGSKETFDANIASKKSQRLQDGNRVGSDRVQSKTAYGTNDAGMIGQSPERALTDDLPNYTKGTPAATPPGATPPVGAQPDGVGAAKPQNQPQETMGRKDIMNPVKADATDYETIRDRIAGKLPGNTFGMNHGATFQHYDGAHTAGAQSTGYNEEAESDDTVLSEEEKEKMMKKKMMQAKMKEKMKEDIDALLSGENLSEEFVAKASTIFEAAVVARAEEVIAEAEQELMEQFEVAVEQIKEDMAAKVDDYLNYMVEEWMKDNEVAIEAGLRSEITEEFIEGLRNLFVEHYIDIPEEKVDVVEELAAKVEQLESALNEEISRGVSLSKDLNEQKKIEAIYTACEGLTQTQVEKLKTLAEGVEFTTEEEFVTKLDVLKESYFKADVKVADASALDEVLVEDEKKQTFADPSMEVYAKTISQTLAK